MWERIVEWLIIISLLAVALFFLLINSVGDEWRKLGS